MTDQDSFRPAVTRRCNLPKHDTIRLSTVQPLPVWYALQEQGTLFVDPDNPAFVAHIDGFPDAYDWMSFCSARAILRTSYANCEWMYPAIEEVPRKKPKMPA